MSPATSSPALIGQSLNTKPLSLNSSVYVCVPKLIYGFALRRVKTPRISSPFCCIFFVGFSFFVIVIFIHPFYMKLFFCLLFCLFLHIPPSFSWDWRVPQWFLQTAFWRLLSYKCERNLIVVSKFVAFLSEKKRKTEKYSYSTSLAFLYTDLILWTRSTNYGDPLEIGTPKPPLQDGSSCSSLLSI